LNKHDRKSRLLYGSTPRGTRKKKRNYEWNLLGKRSFEGRGGRNPSRAQTRWGERGESAGNLEKGNQLTSGEDGADQQKKRRPPLGWRGNFPGNNFPERQGPKGAMGGGFWEFGPRIE